MSKVNTFRLTDFKGLNKSPNPQSIGDKEFVEMTNLMLTKDNSLISRRGYTQIGAYKTAASNNYIRAICTCAWSSYDDRFYIFGKGQFSKIDEATGAVTDISALASAHQPAQTLRYKDKMLALMPPYSNQGSYLYWWDGDEELVQVELPIFTLVPNAESGGTIASVPNTDPDDIFEDTPDLPVGQGYHYSIVIRYGADGSDGITPNARPHVTYRATISGYPVWTVEGDYLHDTVDTAGDYLQAVNVKYVGKLYGSVAHSVDLYRRTAYSRPFLTTGAPGGLSQSYIADGDWKLIDTATLSNTYVSGVTDSDIYIMEQGSSGVIADVTGGYDNDSGDTSLYIDFNDGYANKYEDGYKPYEAEEVLELRSRYMARLHSRVFLANITTTDKPVDNKRVYYSYRGYNEALGGSEIDGIYYPDPMLMFPVNNWFGCDEEDIEDVITGIHTFGNNVIVFTERCMYLWREGMLEPLKLSNTVGCIGNGSIQEFEGKLVWLGRDGVYQYDGSKLTNLTFEKMQPYIDNMRNASCSFATSAIYDRLYFLAAPFESALNDRVIVYDFDLKKWHVRNYKAPDGTQLYIDQLYVDYDAKDEKLYVAGKDASADCFIGRMETVNSDNGRDITCTFKTKYYDFGAPDIEKMYRDWFINATNYFGAITHSIFIDDTDTAKDTYTLDNPDTTGFTLDSATDGVLDTDTLGSWGNEINRFSLRRGMVGSRVQFGASMYANTNPIYLRMIGFNWLPKRGLKARYGA